MLVHAHLVNGYFQVKERDGPKEQAARRGAAQTAHAPVAHVGLQSGGQKVSTPCFPRQRA